MSERQNINYIITNAISNLDGKSFSKSKKAAIGKKLGEILEVINGTKEELPGMGAPAEPEPILNSNVSLLSLNKNLFKILELPPDELNEIDFSLPESKINEINDIVKKPLIFIHGKNKENIHDYEEYLASLYRGYLSPKEHTIGTGDSEIEIRERYPHEEESDSDKYEIIYETDSTYKTEDEVKKAIKSHYISYYEKQIKSDIEPTKTYKNKTDFIELLENINSYQVINKSNSTAIINELVQAIKNDNTVTESGNIRIEIPGTYIMGQHTTVYTIILKQETYDSVKDKLKAIFGNSTGDNLTITRVDVDNLTVERIRQRNKFAINKINKKLNEVKTMQDSYTATKTENNMEKPLKKMNEILSFNSADYSDRSEFTELIGAYVPTVKLDEFLEAAKELSRQNFEFDKEFTYFLPVVMPELPPSSGGVREVPEYEKGLIKTYKHCFPELFHRDDYNYKKDRDKYPHEKFKWVDDNPVISEETKSEYSTYYNSLYKDYVHYRKNNRPVKRITKAPSKLINKVLNSNNVGRTFKDILLAISADYHKHGDDGSWATEQNERVAAFFEKVRLSAILAACGLTIKGLISGFSASMLGPAAIGIGAGTLVMHTIAVIKRIYNSYREIMEARASIAFGVRAMNEANKYKTLLENPNLNAEEKEIYKKIIKAYVAYYIANFNKFERSYERLTKYVKDSYKEEHKGMVDEETTYRTDQFASYWAEAKRMESEYTNLNPDELKEKIEAIKNGRRMY